MPITICRSDGYVFVTDNYYKVSKVNPTGSAVNYAGTGSATYGGDGGQATSASFNRIYGIHVICPSPGTYTVYLSDRFNCRLRMISPTGIITTIAGTGTPGSTGDGGIATSALINQPGGLYVSSDGTIYFGDMSNYKVRKVTSSGIITTIAGTGVASYTGEGGQATSATLNYPYDVVVKSDGTYYIADYANYVIRVVDPSGIINRYAGTGVAGYDGDSRLASTTRIWNSLCMALSQDETILYIADGENFRVRAISKPPSATPTQIPSNKPIITPSNTPTVNPTNIPSFQPTIIPTITPSIKPSTTPTIIPSLYPTSIPTSPTVSPSSPTFLPTILPSIYPTSNPIVTPTFIPTITPTVIPTTQPSNIPTTIPSIKPSTIPTEVL
jgi:hypothetical protein